MQPPTNSPQQVITKTIWLLSLVSLFTDIAGEMLYPVTPLYLKKIGFSVLLIGVLEGVAEAVAGLSKGYFGKLSDASGKRLPFIKFGYALSALSRPIMAFFTYPIWIFFSRTMERLGKGIRTGARDALLSDEATPATKGTVFGFHRSMDTFGAVIGPLIALLYLYYFPNRYEMLFYLAFIPGVLAIIFTGIIREKKRETAAAVHPPVKFFAIGTYWKKSDTEYKKLVLGLLLFALFNSSDVFLLLKMKETGLSDTAVIGIYVFYNLIYALTAYPIGIIADRSGLKKIYLGGLVIFAVVYIGFAFNTQFVLFLVLFFLYGVYAAATDGISKAWISNIAEKNDTATALGSYVGLQSIAALIASSLTGFLWYRFGSTTTFLITAGFTLVVVVYLGSIKFLKK